MILMDRDKNRYKYTTQYITGTKLLQSDNLQCLNSPVLIPYRGSDLSWLGGHTSSS